LPVFLGGMVILICGPEVFVTGHGFQGPSRFLSCLKGEPQLDAGWARRLCSGSILQFVTREEFYDNDIPSLGFYGQKEYMVQNYSCPASPFLMFLPFICLALPDDSPFWTATENEGIWEILETIPIRLFLKIRVLFWLIMEKPAHQK
jgi:hypothetical protein